MPEFRVEYEHGRTSATFSEVEPARTHKAIEFHWSGRIGEIQERVGDYWVRTEDQRIRAAGENS